MSCNTFRHPGLLAHEAMTVDHVSNGRLELGLGAGWFVPEHEQFGIPLPPPGELVGRFHEAVQIVDGLLRHGQLTFTGKYYRLTGAHVRPSPIQRPRPPLTLGAHKTRMLRICAEYADAWNSFGTLGEMRERNAILDEHCAAIGRDPGTIWRSFYGWASKMKEQGLARPLVERRRLRGDGGPLRRGRGQRVPRRRPGSGALPGPRAGRHRRHPPAPRGPVTRARAPRVTRWIARSGAIAVALAVLGGSPAAAEEASETLRLTRLGGGEPAAGFSVATPDGGTLGLGDLRGKVVLLNFWATWCEPCLEEMPAMERLARTYRERGLAVLALSVDREGAPVVRPFLKRHDLTFLVGLDPQQAVARLYRIWALPSTVILSRKGVPLFTVQGAREWDGQAGHPFPRALEAAPDPSDRAESHAFLSQLPDLIVFIDLWRSRIPHS